jgi:hypothetical protein
MVGWPTTYGAAKSRRRLVGAILEVIAFDVGRLYLSEEP